MTIRPYAILPKRCDKCFRRFWMEPYETFVCFVGIEHRDLKCVKCKRCIEKENEIKGGIK